MKIIMKANENNKLKFSDITGHFYITILSLNKNAQIYIDNINIVNMTNSIVKNETNMVLLDIKENQLMEGEQLEIEKIIVENNEIIENVERKIEIEKEIEKEIYKEKEKQIEKKEKVYEKINI